MGREATLGSVPSFFYIGAPRAGSTWLYTNLQRHPVVWVPPCKNISYFHPRFQVYRYQRFRKFGKELLTNGDPAIRRWYRRFFLRPIVNDRWYASLFPPGRVAGEIAESFGWRWGFIIVGSFGAVWFLLWSVFTGREGLRFVWRRQPDEAAQPA